MTDDLFRAWIGIWLDETDPGDGAPRVLFMDNHFSHLGLDTLKLLREHNVRVVSLHPQTTRSTQLTMHSIPCPTEFQLSINRTLASGEE